MKLTRKQHKGLPCVFHAFNDKAYAAQVVDVRRGIACVDYRVETGELIRTYIDVPNHRRLQFFDQLHGGSRY